MSYYPTIEEDLKRAREILERGKDDVSGHQGCFVGTIYAADTYAAYKLLESFVAEIGRLQTDQRMLATALRSLVLCATDNDDWEGSVAEGMTLLHDKFEAVNAEIARLRG